MRLQISPYLDCRTRTILFVVVMAAAFVHDFPCPEVRAADLTQNVLAALRARRSSLDHLYVKYDWSECRASLDRDPFFRENWEFDKYAHTLHFQAWLVRPNYRLNYSGPFKNQKSVDRAWVDNTFISRQVNDDGVIAYTRDSERSRTTGPIPVITPLEMWQIFDIRQGLVELIESGALAASQDVDGSVTLKGEGIEPGSVTKGWTLRATLDPSQQHVPMRMTAELDNPGGRIIWQMRTVSTTNVENTPAIGEAVIALTNSGVNMQKWQVYHYKVLEMRRDMSFGVDMIRPQQPTENAKILDEIGRTYQQFDGSGQMVVERNWTPEERKESKESLRATVTRRAESEAELSSRRRWRWVIVLGAATLSAILGAVWLWRRRNAVTVLQ